MPRSLIIAASALAAVVASLLAVALGTGSSHREAPSSTRDPQADWTDVYAFSSRDRPSALTIVANTDPFQLPQGGPNFNSTYDPKARYYINVDNSGDGRADVRYRFVFRDQFDGTAEQGYPHSLPTVESVDDPQLNFKMRFKLVKETFNSKGKRTNARVLGDDLPLTPGNVGPKTMPDYNAVVESGIRGLRGGGRVFVGARDDPFFIDLGGAFDSVNLCRGTGNEGGCRDDIAGFNVNSIVLQVPEAQVTKDRNAVTGADDPDASVGVWASTERQRLQISNSSEGRTKRNQVQDRDDVKFVQVNRLGNPLVNELVVPLAAKDTFNRTKPEDDKQYGSAVLKPFPAAALNQLFNLGIKEDNRTDIVQALLTGIPGANQIGSDPAIADTLKINLGVPPTETENRFGVIGGDLGGFPNGRRLGDDVVDVTLRVVGGFLVPEDQGGKKLPLGDGVDQNDAPFLATFPYVATPQPGRSVEFIKRSPVHEPTSGDMPK